MIKSLGTTGAKTIRIPVTWFNHIIDEKYTIDPEWMKMVKQVVDWAYDEGYQDGKEEGIEPIYNTEFTLADCSWNESEISWAMKFDEGMDIIMPCDVMDEINCPAIV